ncbi:hypothetical protein [Bacillus sp. 165]|nr:hypothetical protein [Bacillus sp. 165]MBO9128382.1 hypothetical protein [Bacillus sp. 165]
MEKKEKSTPRNRTEQHKKEKFMQSQIEENSKGKEAIQDYNRAWEDDRL